MPEHINAEQSAHTTQHSVGPWQVLVESDLINVLILAFAIIYLANRFLPKIIDQRKKQISKELEEAKQARIKAEQELKNIKQKTERVAIEIQEIKEEAKQAALSIKKQIEQETEKELENLRAKVKKEIISGHDEAIQEIKNSASDEAVKLAQEALSQISASKEVQDKLLEDFLSDLDKPSKN